MTQIKNNVRKSKSELSLKSSLSFTKLLFYLYIWNIIECIYGANHARKVCFSNTRKCRSICCSIFLISSYGITFSSFKVIIKKWAIAIWFVERDIQNRPNNCHSTNTFHSSFSQALLFLVGLSHTSTAYPIYVNYRTLFCMFWFDEHLRIAGLWNKIS